ncbi:MAG: DUF4114 domain-containing protein [Phormidesmis sp.]
MFNLLENPFSAASSAALAGDHLYENNLSTATTDPLTARVSGELQSFSDLPTIETVVEQPVEWVNDALIPLSPLRLSDGISADADISADEQLFLPPTVERVDDALLTGGLVAIAMQNARHQAIAPEQTALDSAAGTFTVGSSGQVEIDFLFDGGAYAGELAFFSLAGMGGLKLSDFVETAARRALSGTTEGQVVITDRATGAQFSGALGERDRNQGPTASTQMLELMAGSKFGLMLVPNGTVMDVLTGGAQPLFSIAALNPNGDAQIGQAADGIFAMEDQALRQSDADFNDLIFRISGATSQITALTELIAPARNWLSSPVAQPFLSPTFTPVDSSRIPPTDSTDPPVTDPPVTDPPTDPTEPTIDPPEQPGSTLPTTVISRVAEETVKFTPGTSETILASTQVQRITLGTQTLYIGTQQVTANNQNPIIRSFDSLNPGNNWTRTDYETTGIDSKGLGLIWSGQALYAVFSADGTQGDAEDDFRRVSGSAKQNWLRSYGSGGSRKVAVIAQIDLATGELLKAAYLSAILQSGESNSLAITGAMLNDAGNLVISAKAFSAPRNPDGTAMTKVTDKSSPFDYSLEITPDLSEVISTAAVGWI